MLLLIRLISRTDSGGSEYVFPQYMKGTPALGEVVTDLVFVFMRWSITDEKDRSTVGGEELNVRTELGMSEWFGVEPFSEICSVVYVAQGNYGTTPLSRPRPRPYH